MFSTPQSSSTKCVQPSTTVARENSRHEGSVSVTSALMTQHPTGASNNLTKTAASKRLIRISAWLQRRCLRKNFCSHWWNIYSIGPGGGSSVAGASWDFLIFSLYLTSTSLWFHRGTFTLPVGWCSSLETYSSDKLPNQHPNYNSVNFLRSWRRLTCFQFTRLSGFCSIFEAPSEQLCSATIQTGPNQQHT